MTDEHVSLPLAQPAAEAAQTSAEIEKKRKKKRDKLRSAWISFIGRILAQVLGAAASIAFGLLILNKAQKGGDRSPDAAPHGTATAAKVAARPVATRARQGDEIALAVLPLQNFSGDVQHDYFAQGMTEALTADLAQTRGLRVVSRTSAMRYTHYDHALPEIARQFQALIDAQSGTSQATVESAFPMDAAQLAEVKAAMERRFLRNLEVSVVVKPELIGGVRVIVGDEVLDTSIRARLEQMKAALVA